MGTNNLVLEKKKLYKFVLSDGTTYIINIDDHSEDRLVIAKNTWQKFGRDNVYIHEQRAGAQGALDHRFQHAVLPENVLAIFTNNIVSITIMNDKQYNVFKTSRNHQEKSA